MFLHTKCVIVRDIISKCLRNFQDWGKITGFDWTKQQTIASLQFQPIHARLPHQAKTAPIYFNSRIVEVNINSNYEWTNMWSLKIPHCLFRSALQPQIDDFRISLSCVVDWSQEVHNPLKFHGYRILLEFKCSAKSCAFSYQPAVYKWVARHIIHKTL